MLYKPEADYKHLRAGSALSLRALAAYASVGEQHTHCVTERAQTHRKKVYPASPKVPR
jgi:hypothetical protein